MPQFTALNGIELKKVILARIEQELDDSGRFQQNLAYPWLKWSASVSLTSYPQAPMEDEPKEIIQVKEELGDDTVSLDQLQPPATVVVVEIPPTVIDTPDQARVDAELPLPTPTPIVNIGIVDKPVMQQKAQPRKGK